MHFAELGYAGELGPVHRPAFGRTREQPCRADAAGVVRSADEGGVAVGGQRHAVAEFTGAALFFAACELPSLRGPPFAGAGEHPGRQHRVLLRPGGE